MIDANASMRGAAPSVVSCRAWLTIAVFTSAGLRPGLYAIRYAANPETSGAAADVPPALRDLPGDITVFLSQSEFVSFTGPFDASSKRVVGIRGTSFPPMTLPNVARNVITHELGHAIGLGHNSDPAMLMCGRPAPCRPALFKSDQPRLFPLTDAEKHQLITMYPSKSKP